MTSKEALEELLGKAISNPYVGMIAAAALEKDLDKLDQYKTIEKEIGIDLITLFKALKNGIYFENDKQHHIVELNLGPSGDYRLSYEIIDGLHENVYVKDYGKTWALTKEELEENGTDNNRK